MIIWVTGGTGSWGSELVIQLKEAFPNAILLNPTRFELDLNSKADVRSFVARTRPTHVFHLAAKVYGIQGHLEDPYGSFFQNSQLDLNVFSALTEYPPTWIFYASSVSAYGFPYQSLPLNEQWWNIGTPHFSELGYALAKRQALPTLQMIHELSQVKFVYGLTTNLFGKADRFLDGRGHVIVSLLAKARIARRDCKALEVWGDGTEYRDFLSTFDASRIVIDLIDKHLEVINIASGQEIFISEIAEQIAEAFRIHKGVYFVPIRGSLKGRVCDVRKLNKFSRYSLNVNSRTALEREIAQIAAKVD